MKLQRIVKNSKPCSYKIVLNGELASLINCYRDYYENKFLEEITAENLMQEIIAYFIANDRDFKRWQRQGNDKKSTNTLSVNVGQ